MKKLFIGLLLTIYLSANDTLNLATVPWRSTEVLQNMYKPLIKLIEDTTGKKVNFFVTSNYTELSKRISTGHVDIAIFGANSYVDAKELLGEKIIYLGTSMQPNDHYNSLILVHKDSDIYNIGDLKNKNFAFTDFASTSGYIYPNLMLHEEGINKIKEYFKTIVMLKKHYRVYDAIAQKAIDGGGATITEYTNATKRNGDIYRIIKKSDPIPNDPIVVSNKVGKQMINKLKKTFKNANSSNYFKKYNTDLKGISIKDDKFYNIVRKAKAFRNKE